MNSSSARDIDLSKVLSHALRHEPWLYELELDGDGWASLDAVLDVLQRERAEWRDLSITDVRRVVDSSSKKRHEIKGIRIRAIYGHSLPGKLRHEAAAPPSVLFHGTSLDTLNLILRDGLKPMSRQYVHLSIDVATAREVARRKANVAVLIEIDAKSAHDSGISFYAGNEKVWLADLVPSRFVRELT
ncbi:MAG: RNA 2'-phosphotransferase [Hyphomicrobiales bacterium]|nr:MAG: RNA 2'-phosphotransferase [Hyphomicrobiales bacterium]